VPDALIVGRYVRWWPRVVVALAVMVGIALRAWFVFHVPLTSDEAVVGLIAQQALHGHTNAFVWTQSVGGVEPYVVAAFFWIFGQGWLSLVLAPLTLSIGAALLVWRVALRLVSDRRLAALAGALSWVWPLPASYQSTVEGGYRGVTLLCGLAALLFALRILDGKVHYKEFVSLGLAVGIGWWSLPEIVYFVLPVLLLVGSAVIRTPQGLRFRHWGSKLGVSGVAFIVGALPWIWANVGSGFASLDSNKFPGTGSPSNPGYFGRLAIFFKDALPLQLDLRQLGIGSFVFGAPGSSLVHRVALLLLMTSILIVVVLCIVLCLLERGRAAAIGVAALAFPFLVALQPGTWFWVDGRYTVYVGALLTLVIAAGAQEGSRRLRVHARIGRDPAQTSWGRCAFGVFAVLAIALTAYSFHRSFNVGPTSYTAAWGNPDQPSVNSIDGLERAGIRTGYAGYWVAYKLDLLSEERLAITVAGAGPDRSQAIDHDVRTSAHPAWLFVPASQMPVAFEQFGAPDEIQGPGGLAQDTFTRMLRRDKIRFRVVPAGLFEAVVPVQRIRPQLAFGEGA
jgi:hypothetical protein